MSEGSVRLHAKAGLRGAKLEWMIRPSGHSEIGSEGEASTETLANYGARDVVAPGAYGLLFRAWRCEACKIVAFSYPQGNKRW